MSQNHLEHHTARAMVADMFPHLPPDLIMTRFESFPEPSSINDIIDDLMAYGIQSEHSTVSEIAIESGDADNGNDDEVDDDSLKTMNELTLLEMFPDFDSARLHRIFEFLDGDFDQTVSILVELASDDLSNYPEEVKILSDLCPLVPISVLHGALVERNFLLDDVIRDIFSETSDMAQFTSRTKLNMADHLKFTSFKRMFPSATEEIILEVMGSENNIYMRSFEALKAIFGCPAVRDETVITIVDPVQYRSLQRQQYHLHEQKTLEISVHDRLDRLYRGHYERITDSDVKEKEIEVAGLSQQRLEIRRRAQNAMASRQSFHGQMLYEKARDLDERINTAREQLMVSRFIQNNPRARELKMIDLHGIYVREARKFVSDFISRARIASCGVVSKVNIIIGIGRHSTTTFSPKLRPAIIHLLRYLKLKFEVRIGEIIVLID